MPVKAQGGEKRFSEVGALFPSSAEDLCKVISGCNTIDFSSLYSAALLHRRSWKRPLQQCGRLGDRAALDDWPCFRRFFSCVLEKVGLRFGTSGDFAHLEGSCEFSKPHLTWGLAPAKLTIACCEFLSWALGAALVVRSTSFDALVTRSWISGWRSGSGKKCWDLFDFGGWNITATHFWRLEPPLARPNKTDPNWGG